MIKLAPVDVYPYMNGVDFCPGRCLWAMKDQENLEMDAEWFYIECFYVSLIWDMTKLLKDTLFGKCDNFTKDN
jgi:hypothetical protein